jgi:hypothetical protein
MKNSIRITQISITDINHLHYYLLATVKSFFYFETTRYTLQKICMHLPLSLEATTVFHPEVACKNVVYYKQLTAVIA